MQSSLYVALSSQLSLARQLEAVAGNIANASTAGHRADQVKFDTLLSHAGADDVAFAGAVGTFISRTAGEMVKTDNPLDVAVQGDAWLAIETATGRSYTRDGRMQLSAEGALLTLTGARVLDSSGAGVQLAPNGGPIEIARDGMISQAGRQAGSLGLFTIDPEARLARSSNSSVVPDLAASAVVDFNKASLIQGHVERGNVNPVLEMTRLIAIQRSFEAVSGAMAANESTMQEALKSLGGSG